MKDNMVQPVRVIYPPHRDTRLLRYRDAEGKSWIKFIPQSNFEYTVELPAGAVILDYFTGEPICP